MDLETREFLKVLDVQVVDVDGLGGDCALWSPRTRTLILCERDCAGRQRDLTEALLARI